MIIEAFKDEYLRYKKLAERAIDQLAEDDLHKILGDENNSVAIIVRHISGNLKSRFTDFLTSDGEKEWRHRDGEFEDAIFSKSEILKQLNDGWKVLTDTLDSLTDDDLNKTVTIRQKPLKAIEALTRSLAHTSYHVGQIITISKIILGKNWKTLSIAKGKSAEYNLNPTLEKHTR
jgi:uncharacterized damage-inducible protein DinB